MASRWNAQGVADDYISKLWGLFLMPFITLSILLLFLLITKIDPLKENIEKFRNYFDGFIISVIIFLFYIYLYTYLLAIVWNLGYQFNISQFLIPVL